MKSLISKFILGLSCIFSVLLTNAQTINFQADPQCLKIESSTSTSTVDATIAATVSFITNISNVKKYEWNFGDPDTTSSTNTSDMKDPIHKYYVAGTFLVSLKVTYNDNSTAMRTKAVIVYPLPYAVFGFQKDQPISVCANEKVTLEVDYDKSKSSILWSNGASTKSIEVTKYWPNEYAYNKPHTFGAVVYNEYMCRTFEEVTVTVKPIPVISAVAVPSEVYAGEPSQLRGSGADYYIWKVLEGTKQAIPEVESPTVNPTERTVYQVTGYSKGCQSANSPIFAISMKTPIETRNETHPITCNNVIMPGLGNDNSKWIIKDVQLYSVCEVFIYNSWGKQVRHWGSNYSNNWDGTADNGTALPDDTYYYLIRSPRVTHTGAITLIRK